MTIVFQSVEACMTNDEIIYVITLPIVFQRYQLKTYISQSCKPLHQ